MSASCPIATGQNADAGRTENKSAPLPPSPPRESRIAHPQRWRSVSAVAAHHPDDTVCLAEGEGEGGCAHLCEPCIRALIASIRPEAEEYARRHCRLTRPPHEYDPEHEYRCTPEEYEYGDRGSYTERAVAAGNRHGASNYDDLIRGLDRDRLRDQVYYAAIRDRVEWLIEEALSRLPG